MANETIKREQESISKHQKELQEANRKIEDKRLEEQRLKTEKGEREKKSRAEKEANWRKRK